MFMAFRSRRYKVSWVDKAHQKNKIHKMIQQAMNTPEYRQARQKDMQQASLRALSRFCLVSCLYMELNFRCGKKGLMKFLDFVKANIEEIGNDVDYIKASNEYYKNDFDLDVLKYMGMEFEGEENEEY